MESTSNPPPPPSPAEEVGEQERNWLELPPDVMGAILHRVGAIDILMSAEKVCTTWRKICKEPSMWRVIDMHNLGDWWDMNSILEKLCRHAIDRSQGQLVDINVEYFGTDDLLEYIADRGSQLRRLQFVCCYEICGWSEAAKKLPLLEDLHLYYTKLCKEDIEAVGRCCPRLKSFKLNAQGYKLSHIECDEEALAVAQNMPGLRHLQLFGNKMTNDGLQAILDGCPLLESLDLRQCFNVTLEGSLGKRCSEQIKDFRRPHDPTDDYGFDTEVHECESHEEDYPSGISDVDLLSDDADYYEFSGGTDYSDDEWPFLY